MRLKVGTKVILKEHRLDSEVNLDIGAVGIIENNDGAGEQPYEVSWDSVKISGNWWVAEECIRPYKIVLENK